MHLKIGKTTNKANVKVHGGFIAEMPIAVLNSATVVYTEPKTLNLVVSYYKSFADKEAGEATINSPMQHMPNQEVSAEKRLEGSFYNLPLVGEANDLGFYETLRLKLVEQFTDVELINN